eukprot:GHVP01042324.1.p1 GENE.GHVP01042324.1~~GHVP01042324.1.p1  ORF type:complete len:358 (-),score=42.84 GHVP01042324.1:37-1110(-)
MKPYSTIIWGLCTICLIIYYYQYRPQNYIPYVRRQKLSLAIILAADGDVGNSQIWSRWLQDYKESSAKDLVSSHLLQFVDLEKRLYQGKKNKSKLLSPAERKNLDFVDPRTTLVCKRFWWKSAPCYHVDVFVNVPYSSVPLRTLEEILQDLKTNRRSRFCFGKFPVMPRRHSEFCVLNRNAFDILEGKKELYFADGENLTVEWQELNSYEYNYDRDSAVFYKDVNLALFRGLQMLYEGDVDTFVNDGRSLTFTKGKKKKRRFVKYQKQNCPVFDPEFYLESLSDEIPIGIKEKITSYKVYCQYCEHVEAIIEGLDIIDLKNLYNEGYWFLGGIPQNSVLENGTIISTDILRDLSSKI